MISRGCIEQLPWQEPDSCPRGAGGGGRVPLYGLYRYVRPQRVGFFSRFNEGTEKEAPGPALGICHVHESYF